MDEATFNRFFGEFVSHALPIAVVFAAQAQAYIDVPDLQNADPHELDDLAVRVFEAESERLDQWSERANAKSGEESPAPTELEAFGQAYVQLLMVLHLKQFDVQYKEVAEAHGVAWFRTAHFELGAWLAAHLAIELERVDNIDQRDMILDEAFSACLENDFIVEADEYNAALIARCKYYREISDTAKLERAPTTVYWGILSSSALDQVLIQKDPQRVEIGMSNTAWEKRTSFAMVAEVGRIGPIEPMVTEPLSWFYLHGDFLAVVLKHIPPLIAAFKAVASMPNLTSASSGQIWPVFDAALQRERRWIQSEIDAGR